MRSGSSRLQPISPQLTRIDNQCYDEFRDRWWDPSGPVSGLHTLNSTRCNYIDQLFQLHSDPKNRQASKFIDIGCGGGLVTEELARRGYSIVGFDVSQNSLAAARKHAAAMRVNVEYRYSSAYTLDLEPASIDGIVICDVLEHLHDLPRAISEIARVLKPGGLMMFDTINRTVRSYWQMIILVQNVFKVVGPNTHDWRLFITPDELRTILVQHGLVVREVCGVTPKQSIPRIIRNVLEGKPMAEFTISGDLRVLFMGYAIKQ